MSYKKKEVRLTKDEFSKIERFGKEFIQVKNDILSGKLRSNKNELRVGNVIYRHSNASIGGDDYIESVINVDIWPREYKNLTSSESGVAHAIHDGTETGKWLWDCFTGMGFGKGVCGFEIKETYENYPPRPDGYEFEKKRGDETPEELETYKRNPQIYLEKYARIRKIIMNCNFNRTYIIPTVKIFIDFPEIKVVPCKPRGGGYPDEIGCSMNGLYY